MYYLVLATEFGALLLITLLGIYDWFYTNSVRKMKKQWGIYFPPLAQKLIVLNSRITLFSIVFLVLLIAYTLYTHTY